MSGTFPDSPGPKDVELGSDQPILSVESESGKSQRRITAGHLWRLRLNYPPMVRSEFAPIYAFETKQRGDSFQVVLPNHAAPRGAVTGTIKCCADYVAENNIEAVLMYGFVYGLADVFKAGDIFNPTGTTKVHMVVEDADAGAQVDFVDEDDTLLVDEDAVQLVDESSGQALVSFSPPLVDDIANDESINHTGVQFTVHIKPGGIQKWKTTAPNLSAYSVDCIESL